MGEVVRFERRPQKLTGFIPADLGKKPKASDYQAVDYAMAPFVILFGIFTALTAVWFSQGWRDR